MSPSSRAGSRFLLSVALLAAASGAAADVVVLRNGKQLEGRVSRAANGDVEILSAAGSLRLPAAMVERIEAGITREQVALDRLAALPVDDVESRLEIARQLEDEGAATLAREVYRQVLDLVPDHPSARRALGEVDCDGQWLSEAACHRRRGEVLHHGRWISSEQWARLEALEIGRRQAELERMRAEARREAAWIEERNRSSLPEPYTYLSYGWPVGIWQPPPHPPHARRPHEPGESRPVPRPLFPEGGSPPPRTSRMSPGQPPFVQAPFSGVVDAR